MEASKAEIFLLGRVPIQLTPQQTFLLTVIAVMVLLAAAGGLILETLVSGGVAAVLRAIGIRAPSKSRARQAIDEFEARVRGAHEPPR